MRLCHTDFMSQNVDFKAFMCIVKTIIHKCVDDTTLSEFIDKGPASQMDVNVTQLLNWSSNNHMNVNFKKTKEMIINTSHCNFPDKLSVSDVEIERVNFF